MLLSLLLLACGGTITAGDPVGDGSVGEDVPQDSPPVEEDPYVADEDPVQPALTLDEVADAVAEGIEATHTIDAGAWFDAYDGVMSNRSSACPYTDDDYDIYNVDYWYDNCTADSGAHYSGYGYGYHYTDMTSGQYFYRHNGYWFGDAKVDLADGSQFVASGYAYLYDYTDTLYGGTAVYFSLFGEFTTSSPLWADSWMGDGLSVSMTLSRYFYGTDPGALQLEGGISHLVGTVNAVTFQDVYMLSAYHGSQCSLEPGGTISVRDDAGDWYDVVFQGPDPGSTTAFPAECDGCGEVWFRGTPLGDVCPDLSTLVNWGA